MLPYQEDKKLEKLLGSLFGDNDELEDFVVLNDPVFFGILSTCCTYSYACYD